MTIEKRLEELERKSARAQFINRLSALLEITLLLIMWFFTYGTPIAQERVLDDIRVRNFILEDVNGEICAALGVFEDRPSLVLYDKNEKPRIMLGVTNDGPQLYLFYESGLFCASLGADKNGRPGLALYDETGKARAVMGITKVGPTMYLQDEKGKPLWRTP